MQTIKVQAWKAMVFINFYICPVFQDNFWRDLLQKLQVTITFKNVEVILEVNDEQYIETLSVMLAAIQMEKEISEEIINQAFPGVWTSNVPGRVKNAPPTVIKTKEGNLKKEKFCKQN